MNTPGILIAATGLVLAAAAALAQDAGTADEISACGAWPGSPPIALIEEASRYGEQQIGERVAIPCSSHFWQMADSGSEQRLMVTDAETGRTVAELPVACFFCSGEGDNCSADGVFVLRDFRPPSRSLLFQVCHKGAHSQRLTLIDPTVSAGKAVLDIVGDYYLEWTVENDRLHVTPDGDPTRAIAWPPSEE